jgi:hypothetical protein
MPLYFSEVAPTCPISTDSSTGPRERHLFNRPIFTRPTIPRLPPDPQPWRRIRDPEIDLECAIGLRANVRGPSADRY